MTEGAKLWEISKPERRFPSAIAGWKLLVNKKDNFLFALYTTGKATALVTGDKLLIKEAAHNKMQVINWQDFKQLINIER